MKAKAHPEAHLMAFASDHIVQHLQREYERVATHIRLLESVNDKIVSIAVTLLVAGFAYGVHEDISLMFLFLPVAFIGVFLYATLQYVNMYWMGGYARAIEDKINSLAGTNLLYWETLVATVRPRSNVNNLSLVGIYLVLFVGVAWECFQNVFEDYGAGLGWTYAAVVVLLSACLLFSTREMLSAYGRAYKSSREAFK